MIVSFEVKKMDDLNLLLQLTNRLGIKQVEEHQKSTEQDSASEINDEINDIFGNDNTDLYL